MSTSPVVQRVHYDTDFPLVSGGKGAWQVYRYDLVRDVLFDYASYGNGYMSDNGMLGSNINQTDPPLHGQLRALISGVFSRSAISSLESFMEHTAKSLLLDSQSSTIDIARDYAFPLTATVICKILGIKAIPEIAKVNAWAKAIVTAGYIPGGMEQAAAAQQEMAALFMQVLLQGDGTGLIKALSYAEIEGRPLDPQIQIGTCMTVLLAGYETTANLITNAVHQLAVVQVLQKSLRQTPDKIPNFLLEILRLYPSIVSMYRIATKDLKLDGNSIKSGDILNGWISAANRDPEIFPDPDQLDIDRPNSSHALSFGYGIHHCIGAILARTQARIALEVLLETSASMTLAGTEPLRTPSLITPGFQSMLIKI
ncbi:cytochrome P450 [Chitinophaga sp. Mgbs1]|uniref:Cytochrome P450 n=1 Tax=Chitinophaga solisilvae TaxID=1233460 RepID=A0A3S1DM06_9BACT|nr:cytochrome P450 [Chitinophaga solisilvae]